VAKVQDVPDILRIIFAPEGCVYVLQIQQGRRFSSDTALKLQTDTVDLKYLAAKAPHVIFAVLYRKCRVGQGVKTPPFHGGITGSNPVRGTK
jgi:hypothetical protein